MQKAKTMPVKYNRKGYLGNSNLKPVGVKIDFTKEQVEEYLKCASDPIHFARNYIKVVSLDSGIVPFDLYDYQENIINTIDLFVLQASNLLDKLFFQPDRA